MYKNFFIWFLFLSSFYVHSHGIKDYEQLAQIIDWPALISSVTFGNSIRLLDIGCGTGRWLKEFNQEVLKGSKAPNILFDLLDPSAVALRAAADRIKKPFLVNKCVQDIIQEAQLNTQYDVVWAIHSFYALQAAEIPFVLQKCMNLLNENGRFLIVLAAENSFYIRCYNMFRECFYINQLPQYATAQMIQQAVNQLDLKVNVQMMQYDEIIPKDDVAALNHFILNECIGYSFNRDDQVVNLTIQDLLDHQRMGAFMASFEGQDQFRFPQEVWLFSIKQ